MKNPETGWGFPDFCFVCACRDSCAFGRVCVRSGRFVCVQHIPNTFFLFKPTAKPFDWMLFASEKRNCPPEDVFFQFYLRSHQFICAQQNLFAFKIFYLRSAQVYLCSAFFDKKIPAAQSLRGFLYAWLRYVKYEPSVFTSQPMAASSSNAPRIIVALSSSNTSMIKK